MDTRHKLTKIRRQCVRECMWKIRNENDFLLVFIQFSEFLSIIFKT